jgi:hypothetical protein
MAEELVVDKLALLSVGTLARRRLMPLFAHFRLVILVRVLLPPVKLVIAMGVSAIFIELAIAELCKVFAKFGLVVESEVFDATEHFGTRSEVHLLFRSLWGVHLLQVALHLLYDLVGHKF